MPRLRRRRTGGTRWDEDNRLVLNVGALVALALAVGALVGLGLLFWLL